MKNVFAIIVTVVCALVLVGCSAANIEKLSSGSLQYDDVSPTLREQPTAYPDPFGVSKRLIITNPLPYSILAQIECSSMFQSDQFVHVMPHRERYIPITAPGPEQSCFLIGYVIVEKVSE